MTDHFDILIKRAVQRGQPGQLYEIGISSGRVTALAEQINGDAESSIDAGGNVYALQLRAFAQAIRGERSLSTDANDAVNNMRVIDAIYTKAGLALRGI